MDVKITEDVNRLQMYRLHVKFVLCNPYPYHPIVFLFNISGIRGEGGG